LFRRHVLYPHHLFDLLFTTPLACISCDAAAAHHLIPDGLSPHRRRRGGSLARLDVLYNLIPLYLILAASFVHPNPENPNFTAEQFDRRRPLLAPPSAGADPAGYPPFWFDHATGHVPGALLGSP
jgi:hypothetical protein